MGHSKRSSDEIRARLEPPLREPPEELLRRRRMRYRLAGPVMGFALGVLAGWGNLILYELLGLDPTKGRWTPHQLWLLIEPPARQWTAFLLPFGLAALFFLVRLPGEEKSVR